MSKRFRGYYGIAMTPFSVDGDILWDELAKEADWVVRCGAHGLVWPVNDSEFTRLSFPERIQGISPVVDAVNRRIPVIIGVADASTAGAVALAEEAARAGAASYVPDIDAQIWDLMEAGDETRARQIEDSLAILEKARRGTPAPYVDRKQILVWRGVFTSNAARLGSRPIDDAFRAELAYGYQAVEPFFRV